MNQFLLKFKLFNLRTHAHMHAHIRIPQSIHLVTQTGYIIWPFAGINVIPSSYTTQGDPLTSLGLTDKTRYTSQCTLLWLFTNGLLHNLFFCDQCPKKIYTLELGKSINQHNTMPYGKLLVLHENPGFITHSLSPQSLFQYKKIHNA